MYVFILSTRLPFVCLVFVRLCMCLFCLVFFLRDGVGRGGGGGEAKERIEL